jgi:hypothetical protein
LTCFKWLRPLHSSRLPNARTPTASDRGKPHEISRFGKLVRGRSHLRARRAGRAAGASNAENRSLNGSSNPGKTFQSQTKNADPHPSGLRFVD